MAKQIIYGTDARASIKEGIDAIANAVKTTLGPKGRCVLIDGGYGDEVKMTKDGVTVAKSIELDDKMKNAGAKFIKKVASKTAEDAGDGTTTATVLAQAIVAEGSKLVAAGISPMELKRGIDKAAAIAVESFKASSQEVSSIETLKEVATVSANGDQEVGEMIADVINSVGADGVVTVETSKTIETYIEKVQGLKFDRGYISNYFITNGEKLQAELENPYILITDQKITTIKQLQPVLEAVAMQNRPIFIISDGVEGEALTMLVVNKMRGTLKVCAAKCPAFGDRRKAELDDIAAVVGGIVITADKGLSLDKVTIDQLGQADKVITDAKNTTIVGGRGDKEQVEYLIESIRHQMEEEKLTYNKDILRQRLAKLVGGVAILYVGAMTEVELNEKKDRIDDALCATRAANEEGTLPGGGVAYLNASLVLNGVDTDMTQDEKIGFNLMAKALQAPLTQIVDNSLGESEGRVVVAAVINHKIDNVTTEDRSDYGYNARTGEFGDLRAMGVIDPTKVCRTAVENAASIAGMYLTTGCVVVDEPEKKESNQIQM